MPDVDFTWLPDLKPPGPAWANRLAVARGTLSYDSRAELGPAQQMSRVQVLWRNQLARLRREPKAGVPGCKWAVADSKRLPWLRNCPPYGVCCRSPKKLRICGHQQVCPWCWGRRVVAPAYRAVVRAVALNPGCRVTVLRWASDHPTAEVGAAEVQAGAAADMRTAIAYWRKAGALGGVATWTAAPGPEGHWRTVVRLMLVVPGSPLAVELGDGLPPYSRQWVDPDRRSVVRAASAFARYPGALLTKPPGLVADLLTSRPAGRHFTSFGVCYAGYGRPRKGADKSSGAKTINPGDA